MQGIELIKNLAELDEELSAKVEEARLTADGKIKSAEAESARLLAEAEAQIRQMEEEAKTRMAEESAKLADDARTRAAAEKTGLRSRALPNLDRAVRFVLSEVLP
jgi:vacuolar-type H+-ATPase subunit H